MSGLFEKLYQYSPSFLQNLGVSAYGLKLFRREYGKSLAKISEEFEKQQWYSKSDLDHYQDEKLSRLIIHCYENVPYYRMTAEGREQFISRDLSP